MTKLASSVYSNDMDKQKLILGEDESPVDERPWRGQEPSLITGRSVIVWQELRTFLQRGNVLDLAIGVIIGGAFGKIVTSLVNDIIMPPIGLLLGKVNFTNLYINLSSTHYASLAQAQNAGAPTINYGVFLNTIINFCIVALVVFFEIVKTNELLKKRMVKPQVVEVTTKPCPYCLSTIALMATRCPNCTSVLEEAQ